MGMGVGGDRCLINSLTFLHIHHRDMNKFIITKIQTLKCQKNWKAFQFNSEPALHQSWNCTILKKCSFNFSVFKWCDDTRASLKLYKGIDLQCLLCSSVSRFFIDWQCFGSYNDVRYDVMQLIWHLSIRILCYDVIFVTSKFANVCSFNQVNCDVTDNWHTSMTSLWPCLITVTVVWCKKMDM